MNNKTTVQQALINAIRQAKVFNPEIEVAADYIFGPTEIGSGKRLLLYCKCKRSFVGMPQSKYIVNYHSFIDELILNDDNICNTTATLSTLTGVAQPWRFFVPAYLGFIL